MALKPKPAHGMNLKSAKYGNYIEDYRYLGRFIKYMGRPTSNVVPEHLWR